MKLPQRWRAVVQVEQERPCPTPAPCVTRALAGAGGEMQSFKNMERAGAMGAEELGSSPACCVTPDKQSSCFLAATSSNMRVEVRVLPHRWASCDMKQQYGSRLNLVPSMTSCAPNCNTNLTG